MITLQSLSVVFVEGNDKLYAVNDVNLELPCNEFISIIGRSGSGKSTTLSVIGGLLQPTCGQVVVDGESIYSYKEKELANYRRQNIGFIFQSFNLEEMYTVYQNIEIALMISGYPKSKREERIDELLDCVGLSSKKKVQVKKLSGGEKQRVCIARAIANKPKIILADEPCGNLDTNNSRIVMDLLRKLVSKDTVVILVTHNMEDAQKTDRIIEMRDGKIVKNECVR
jgi:ABC-type lipoprotein export system ATPase subunit